MVQFIASLCNKAPERMNPPSQDKKDLFEKTWGNDRWAFQLKTIEAQIPETHPWSIFSKKLDLQYFWNEGFSNPFEVCGSYTGFNDETKDPMFFSLDYSQSGFENRGFEFATKITVQDQELDLQNVSFKDSFIGNQEIQTMLMGIPGYTDKCLQEGEDNIYNGGCLRSTYTEHALADLSRCLPSHNKIDFSAGNTGSISFSGGAVQLDSIMAAHYFQDKVSFFRDLQHYQEIYYENEYRPCAHILIQNNITYLDESTSPPQLKNTSIKLGILEDSHYENQPEAKEVCQLILQARLLADLAKETLPFKAHPFLLTDNYQQK